MSKDPKAKMTWALTLVTGLGDSAAEAGEGRASSRCARARRADSAAASILAGWPRASGSHLFSEYPPQHNPQLHRQTPHHHLFIFNFSAIRYFLSLNLFGCAIFEKLIYFG